MKKLFCIPCGGTSAVLFAEWKKYFGEQIELLPLEIPGRGSKADKSLNKDLHAVAEELSLEIEQKTENQPYSILGLCYGALVGYEICRIFEQKQKPLPEHLYICASPSPQPTDPILYTPLFLREEFRNEVYDMFRRLFPPQLFPDPEFAVQLSKQMVKIFYEKIDKIQLTAETDPSEVIFYPEDVSSLPIDQSMKEYMIEFTNSLITAIINDEIASLIYYQSSKEKKQLPVKSVIVYGTKDELLNDSWKDWSEWLILEKAVPTEQNHLTLMWDVPEISNAILESEEHYV